MSETAMKNLDRPSTPSLPDQAVQASDFTGEPLSRRERVEVLMRRAGRLGAASPSVIAVVQAGIFAAVAVGACLSWIAQVLPTLQRVVMWTCIVLTATVLGAYAACSRPGVPQPIEIVPDPDFHPLPVPVPSDGELVASVAE